MDNNFAFSAKRLDNGEEIKSLTIIRCTGFAQTELEYYMAPVGSDMLFDFDSDGNVTHIHGKFYRIDPDSIEPVMQED